MPIRKFGTEPAKTETRTEDNDPQTLESVRDRGRDVERDGSESGSDGERPSRS